MKKKEQMFKKQIKDKQQVIVQTTGKLKNLMNTDMQLGEYDRKEKRKQPRDIW